jgi:hypothetical protein
LPEGGGSCRQGPPLSHPAARAPTRRAPAPKLTTPKYPQGEFVAQLAELVLKNYGASNGIKRSDIYVIEAKKKRPFFDDAEPAPA